MNNLDIRDIRRILKLNNVIGAHTFSHKNLKNIKIKKRLILKLWIANKLQKILKIKIINFSFNFGRLEHISPTILNLSKIQICFYRNKGENSKSKKIF